MLGQRTLCVLFPPHFPHPSWHLFGLGCFTHWQLCFRVLFSCERMIPLYQLVIQMILSLSCKEESCVTYVLLGCRCCCVCPDEFMRRIYLLPSLSAQAASLLLVPAPQTWSHVSATLQSLSRLQIYVVDTSLCSSSQAVQADALHSRLSHPCSAKFTIMKVTL